MMDSREIVTHAAKGIVTELADEYEVSLTRMYEILGKDNPVPKTKRLCRKIARLNQTGARLIKADFDAMWAEVLTATEEPSLEDMHKEAYEAVDSVLRGKPLADQKTQILELVDICQRKLVGIEKREQLKAV